MRKFAILFCFCVMMLPGRQLQAQSESGKGVGAVPGFILAGLKAYKNSGPDAAMQTWMKGSPIDGNQDVQAQLNILHQIQDSFGAYQSFEVISTHDFGPRTRILYLILDFDRGPLFSKFVVYHSDQGWLLTSFSFNTHDDAIFPAQ